MATQIFKTPCDGNINSGQTMQNPESSGRVTLAERYLKFGVELYILARMKDGQQFGAFLYRPIVGAPLQIANRCR